MIKYPEIAPLFQKLNAEGSESYEKNKEQIERKLIEIAQKKFHHFKSTASEAEYAAFAAPIVERYQNLLLDTSINGVAFDPATATVKDITEILKKHCETSYSANDPFYGDLASDLLFKVGEFPMETLINWRFKDTISTTLTGAVSEIRGSHDYLMDLITEGLKGTLLNKQYVSELLSEQPSTPAALVPQKLAHQIQLSACLAHDLLMRKAEGQGKLYKSMVQLVLTDSPNKVEGSSHAFISVSSVAKLSIKMLWSEA